MIVGVGLYAIFGALVMQKLETKPVQRSKRSLETGIQPVQDEVGAILCEF